MVVLVIENAPEKLRGELTRWLVEAKPGVFVGNLSALVREKLWDKIEANEQRKGAIIIFSAATEQGFEMRMCGEPSRKIIDIEGVQLICVSGA